MNKDSSNNFDDIDEKEFDEVKNTPQDQESLYVPPINTTIGSMALTSGLEKVISDCAPKNIMMETEKFSKAPNAQQEAVDTKFYKFTSNKGETILISPTCTNDTLGNNRANPASGNVTMAEIMEHVRTLYDSNGKYLGGNEEVRILVPTNDIKRRHWVTNEIKVGPKGIEINTYDSMNRLPLLSRIANKISHFFNNPKKDAINAFKDLGSKSPQITSKQINTGTQKDDTNCGRHTLANIESLIQTGEPYTEKDEKKIQTKLEQMQTSMNNPNKVNHIEAHNNEAKKNTSPPLNQRQLKNIKLVAEIKRKLFAIKEILNRQPKKKNSQPTPNKRNNTHKEHRR